MTKVADAVQTLGKPCSARAVAKHLGAVDANGRPLPAIAVALELLKLQEEKAISAAVLEKLMRGLTVTALKNLARTIRANHEERLAEQS
ncbi:MAG: hypothetical protein ABSA33_00415 [Candidatus Micrarchaeaceae archaeon]